MHSRKKLEQIQELVVSASKLLSRQATTVKLIRDSGLDGYDMLIAVSLTASCILETVAEQIDHGIYATGSQDDSFYGPRRCRD